MGQSFTWFIYALLNVGGAGYVGATKDLPRRMREHRRTFGFDPEYIILEIGHSIEWRTAEHRWIEYFRRQGKPLRNRTTGGEGVQTLSAEARRRLSEVGRGRRKSALHKARISASQKRRPKSWSEEGAKRVAATQFKPGHKNWEKLSAKTQAEIAQRSRDQWKRIPVAERSLKAAERASAAWSNRSNADRKTIGRKISAARMSMTPERRAELSRMGALARLKQPGAAKEFGRRVRKWWASLSERDKRAFITRRAIAIKKARDAKRRAAQKDPSSE